MKYYKSLLFVLLIIIILSLLYNHIYNVNEKFATILYPGNQTFQNTDTIIQEIVLNDISTPLTPSVLPPNVNLAKCDGSVCLSNLTFNSEYPNI